MYKLFSAEPEFFPLIFPLQIILVPGMVGQSCLLLNETLSTSQIEACDNMTLRAYSAFDNLVYNVHGRSNLTGANTLDVAKIGLDQGLRVRNVSLITDAFRRIHYEVALQQNTSIDGIRSDGSFGQHGGVIYNGNYGKV